MSVIPAFIKERAQFLEGAGIESAHAEVEWILCHVLEVERLQLYLHGDQLLSPEARARIDDIIERRRTRYPLQYILQESWFYGRRFSVSPAVMVPTPETEGLCEVALHWLRTGTLDKPRLLDVGVGSGVISVTLAAENIDVTVVSLDVSEDAIAVARQNATSHEVHDRIEFRASDYFAAVGHDEKYDLILSNPPYIREPDYADLEPEVKADPKVAMTAGDDGLDAIRVLIAEGPKYLAKGGRMMFEIGLGQSDDIAVLTEADNRYTSLEFRKDLNDIDRICILGCE